MRRDQRAKATTRSRIGAARGGRSRFRVDCGQWSRLTLRRRPPRGRVLVTDGEFKHTLGIVRALDACGHEVRCSSPPRPARRRPLARGAALASRPAATAPGYDEALFQIAGSPRAAQPDPGRQLVRWRPRSGLRDRWPTDVRVALPPASSLETANDKACTAEVARRAGIANAARAARVERGGGGRGTGRAAARRWFLKSRARGGTRRCCAMSATPPTPATAFAAASRPRRRRAAARRRRIAGDGLRLQRALLERRAPHAPRSCTGACASGRRAAAPAPCAESLPEMPPDRARAGAARCSDALKWHGVAMVEFKGALTPRPLRADRDQRQVLGLARSSRSPPACGFPCDLVDAARGPHAARRSAPVPRVRFCVAARAAISGTGAAARARCRGCCGTRSSPAVAHSFRLADPLPTPLRAARSGFARRPGAWREQRDAAMTWIVPRSRATPALASTR